jgi:hypothetical protein
MSSDLYAVAALAARISQRRGPFAEGPRLCWCANRQLTQLQTGFAVPDGRAVMLQVYPGFFGFVTFTVTCVAVAPAAIAITFPSLASKSIVVALAVPVLGAIVEGKRL